tara:strand:- start:302 stop:598 length:297 start_codon:yes stop_codon:yes gene_type:complete
MDNDIFERPAWVSYLPYIALGTLLLSLGAAVCLVSGAVPDTLSFFAVLAAISPIFLVFAIVPVLNNEMRLVDSIRLGLIRPDLTENEDGLNLSPPSQS